MHVDLKPSNADELDMDSMVVNSSKPFFSIIIPVYNKEKVVLRSIESALNQSCSDYEIIVVLDPSSDKSSEIVRSLTDPRIRVFERDNPGPGGYAARNVGMDNAKGRWIVFLDADDEWKEGSLAVRHKLIMKGEADVVCTSWEDCDAMGVISKPRPIEERLLPVSQFYSALAFEKRLVHTNTIAFSRDLFARAGGFPEGRYLRGGDVATWIKLAYVSGFVRCTTLETAVYHKEDSTVTKQIPPAIKGNAVFDMCNEIKNKANVSPGMKRALKELSNRHIRYGLVYKVKFGRLHVSDLEYFRFSVSPFDYSLFLALSLLPSIPVRLFVKFSLSLKRLFQRK